MQSVYPNQFLPSKKTRDFSQSDTVISLTDARILAVAAGTTIAPDTLVLLSSINPDTVIEAVTGTPVIGVDTPFGTSVTYSNNTTIAAGNVGVSKILPGGTYRVKLNTALVNQAGVDAIIGNQYLILSNIDGDGFVHQVLDNSVSSSSTAAIRVIDADYTTNVALVEILG